MLYIPFRNQGKFLCIYGSRRGMIAKKNERKKMKRDSRDRREKREK